MIFALIAPGWVSSLGESVVGLAAILTALGIVLNKTPVGQVFRWLIRRNVIDPLRAVATVFFVDLLHREVPALVKAELERTNGGSAFGDRFKRIEDSLEQGSDRFTQIEEHLTGGKP